MRPAVAPADLGTDTAAADQMFTQTVLNLAMRIAETLLTVGASANDVTLTALQITRAYGLRSVHGDVTYNSISVSYQSADHAPISLMRVIRSWAIDFSRLQRIQSLVARIETGLDLAEARSVFDTEIAAAAPYRTSIIAAANATLAAGVCILMGASLVVTAIAFIAALLADIVQRIFARKLVPAFFTQAAGAFIVTAVAIGTSVLARSVASLQGAQLSLIVAAGIVMMHSGMSVVGSAQDAIDGFYVTAGARVFAVMVLTLGIVVGITVALQLGNRVGYGIFISDKAPMAGSLGHQVVGVVLIAIAYALGNSATMRTVCLGGAMGLVGWGGYLGGTWLGLGATSASALGALAGAFISTLVARRLHVPSLALTTAAIVPLVPGSAVFRGLLQLVNADGSSTGMVTGAATLLSPQPVLGSLWLRGHRWAPTWQGHCATR